MVKTINISKLNAAPYNPREELKPGMSEYEKLKSSIEQFGNVEPIVWNERTGRVVGGHQRLTVLKDMGETEIPCSIVDLSDEDERVLNIALNRIKGDWDYDKVREVLDGFDYETKLLSGFSAEEIAILTGNDDDLVPFEDNFDDWDDEGEEETGAESDGDYIGGSWVITLIFDDRNLAMNWASREGYEGHIKSNASTTVIRIED